MAAGGLSNFRYVDGQIDRQVENTGVAMIAGIRAAAPDVVTSFSAPEVAEFLLGLLAGELGVYRPPGVAHHEREDRDRRRATAPAPPPAPPKAYSL